MNPMFVIGGAALTAKMILNKRSECPIPSFKGIIETAHYIPGRVRFRIPILKNSSESVQTLRDQLNKINAIKSVEITELSCSALINFNEEKIDPMMLFGVIAKLLSLDEQMGQYHTGCLSGKFKGLKKIANNSIYNATNGILDFKSLLGLSLFGGAMYSAGGRLSNISSPGPATLTWWAYNSL